MKKGESRIALGFALWVGFITLIVAAHAHYQSFDLESALISFSLSSTVLIVTVEIVRRMNDRDKSN
jgi:membrane protein implicated in regulation of membrane protease activity